MNIVCVFWRKRLAVSAFSAAMAAIPLLLCQCGDAAATGGETTDPAHQPDTVWYANNPDAAAFEVSTADELAGLALLVNGGVDFKGKTIALKSDIDLSAGYGAGYNGGYGWIPIGDGKDNPFRGVFDGRGNAVRGLYINTSGYNPAGLFGCVADSAIIKGLGLTGVSVKGWTFIGGVVGTASGGSKVIDCHAAGDVGGRINVGGIAGGVTGGEVSGCGFAGAVGGSGDEIGGIAGGVDGVKIADCHSHGGAVSGGSEVGGIVGSVTGTGATEIAGCYSTVSVAASIDDAGGIAGRIYNNTKVTGCAAMNKGVKAPGVNIGRVAGRYDTGNSTLSGNAAFAGMENNAGDAEWGNKGADKQDGKDLSAAEINADGTLGGLFKAADGWTTENGKLPGRNGAAVDMPEHLR